MAEKKVSIGLDTDGARSRLRFHYFTGLLGFAAASGAWAPGRTSIIMGAAGSSNPEDGDSGSQAGIDGNLNRGLTDFLKGGYVTEKACYTITSIGFDVVSDVFQPTTVDGDLSDNSFVCSSSGEVVDDCISRRNRLIRAILASCDVEIQREGETCELIVGNPEQNPASMGFASANDASNSAVFCTNRMQLKRPIVMDPKTNNGSAYEFFLNFRTTQSVQQDPAFAAVADATVAAPEAARCRAMLIRMTLDGYVSDEDGNPVNDETEMRLAGVDPGMEAKGG